MALELILMELRPFEISFFRQFLQCWLCSLCNQLLPQFSVNVSQTLQASCGHIEDVHVGIDGAGINFDQIKAFLNFGSFFAL